MNSGCLEQRRKTNRMRKQRICKKQVGLLVMSHKMQILMGKTH
jgi:hypothetical protein